MVRAKTVAITLGVLFGSALLMIALCGGLLYLGFTKADDTVSPHVDAMFAAIESDTFADTYETHTAEEYREAASREDHAALGAAIRLRLGKLESKSLRQFNMRQHNAESYIDVTYNATFEEGTGTIEAQLKKEGGEWKFMRLHVNSPVFEQDLATVACSACGEPHPAAAKFCPSCGAEVGAVAQTGDAGEEASEIDSAAASGEEDGRVLE